jgi:hypothetical protein
VEVEPYTFALLVYEELRRRLWPLNTNISVHTPWPELTDVQQRHWEEAVERALVRSGVVKGDAEPGGYIFHRPRKFKQQKEGEL